MSVDVEALVAAAVPLLTAPPASPTGDDPARLAGQVNAVVAEFGLPAVTSLLVALSAGVAAVGWEPGTVGWDPLSGPVEWSAP